MTAASGLAEARSAVERGEWARALELLDGARRSDGAVAAADHDEAADALELRALAAYGDGQLEAAVGAWEQLYALRVGDGDDAGAAEAAAMVALYLMMDTGLMAAVRGWLGRAERLLEAVGEVPAHAVAALVRTYERFMCGDVEAAGREAERTVDLGTRLGVQPAAVIGRVAGARVRILTGDVAGGLAQLDEIGTLLMSGGVDPLTTGMMYCELICAAQGLAMHERAREWTELMERWRHGAAYGGINGRCRVHRAEILRVCGPCDDAEAEALGACEELRPWMRREFGWPLVELGTIRLRKGDLAGAEEAFLAAHEHAWSPQPGLALLRMEQGDLEAARSLIADAIAHPFDIPSKERPPFGDLRLAPLYDAQAEIAAAAGDAGTAGAAAEALAAIAWSYPSRCLQASADLARARAALTAGDAARAIGHAAAAVAAWAEVGAPYEVAAARTVLGHALLRADNPDAARLEWRAARSGFEGFGAAGRARQLSALLDGDAERPAPEAAAVQAAAGTFRRSGDTRTVAFAGRSVVLRDLKGFRYLERLLADPGRELHALDLVAVEHGTLRTPAPAGAGGAEAGGGRLVAGAGLPVLDDQARAAYRRRLAEVEDDIEEATAANDLGRVALAERDRQYLVAELSRAVGLGGRHRTTGDAAERARTSVARSLRYAVARLGEHHPELAAHLSQRVRTGLYCRYLTDPAAPVRWEV